MLRITGSTRFAAGLSVFFGLFDLGPILDDGINVKLYRFILSRIVVKSVLSI